MRYAILFCLFLSVASAQEVQIPTGAFMMQHTIKMDTLTNDSTKVFTLPTGAVIIHMHMMVDSSGSSQRITVGIQGEEVWGRYIDLPNYTFAQGSYTGFSSFMYICERPTQIWLYSTGVSTPPPQIRFIIEYRQL